MAGPETPYPTGALNKWDILPRFGDRVLMAAQEPVRMESLDLQANLMQRPLVTDDLAAQYNAIAPENGVVGERESVRLKPISVQLISRDPKTPISLVVYKHMKLDDDQQWYDRVEAGVLRGDLTRETDENIV